jgi:hypothetical protein
MRRLDADVIGDLLVALMILALALLLVGCTPRVAPARRTAIASAATAPCVRHSPFVRLAAQVVLLEAGQSTVTDIRIRNADSCGCPESCFQLSAGYHPPYDDTASVRLARQPYLRWKGTALNGACLLPGEEIVAQYHLDAAATQEGPGYLTPVAFAYRQGFPCYTFTGGGQLTWGTGCVEMEGDAACIAMPWDQCWSYTYQQGPSQ